VALILATAFFVAAEFAVVAVERSRLDSLAEQGSRAARTALAVHRRLSFHLSAAQLGLTIVSLVLGFIAEPTLARALHPLFDGILGERAASAVSIALALALATVLSMVVGELIPKNVVIARPERSALRLAGPLRFFSIPFGPFIKVSNGTANRLVRALGIEPQEELVSVRSLDELSQLIRSSGEEGTLTSDKVNLLARSIRFGEKTAADALVPRIQVETVPGDAPVAELVARAVASGHSRFPVVGSDADDVVGVVHVKDVYRLPPGRRLEAPVSSIMRMALAVPETRPLEDLFGELRSEGTHLAVVIDEYGGTAGIVTLEDLLEEIVGEIDDEYDPPTTAARFERRSGTWVMGGILRGDEVREACGFEMPEGEYDTIAGFLLDRLGHLPGIGEAVTEDGWRFEVAALDRHRIATVRVTPPGSS
jgi:CBS domain containing-hemolysin-like protein